ncbi:MAG: hypothetical protein J6A49_08145 [Clostridia bacterium]|nr:hypothetical protein [Clostridia bacterium]
MNKIIKLIENLLFWASLVLLIAWLLLAVFNVMEGWEIPVLVPLIYCVIKLRQISKDNEKIKAALKIDESKDKE